MVYFRVDCNEIISSGHLMRCLAISKELEKRGEQTCFLVADENSVPILKNANASYITLNSDWQNLLSDVNKVRDILAKEYEPILLIDTYKIIDKYVEALRPYCKIAYLGSKSGFLGKLDLIINYSTNIDYNNYTDNYDATTTLLLGPLYAPLREEFQHITPKYKDRISRILITTGNTCRDNIVYRLLQKIKPYIDELSIKIDVVIGQLYIDKEELHQNYDSEYNIILHENVQSMSSLMDKCDLAISANGTTVYELSAMGVPTISFAMVEEQVQSAEALAKLGVLDYCGKSYINTDECVNKILNRILYYNNNYNDLIKLGQKAHSLIDGNGVPAIVDSLLSIEREINKI